MLHGTGEDAISVVQLKELAGSKDVVLIVPDGSFRGARKMVSKYPSNFPRGKYMKVHEALWHSNPNKSLLMAF